MYSLNHDTVQVCNWCIILCLQFVKYPINLNQTQINHHIVSSDPLHPVPPSPTPTPACPVFPAHPILLPQSLVTSLLPQCDLLPLQPPPHPQPDRSPPLCEKLPASPPPPHTTCQISSSPIWSNTSLTIPSPPICHIFISSCNHYLWSIIFNSWYTMSRYSWQVPFSLFPKGAVTRRQVWHRHLIM